MASRSSPIVSLGIAAAIAIAGSLALTRFSSHESTSAPKVAAARPAEWSATASGRVEPLRGEIRLSAPAPGRIVEIAVATNDRVKAGDFLIRLDDEDARARVIAAEAEALVRKRERDAETQGVARFAMDRRQADDNFASAERAVAAARLELERVLRARRTGSSNVTEETVQTERANVTTALERLELERTALKRASNVAGLPLPTRVEAGLTAARAELALAEAAFDRTRIRAPSDGTVLQIGPRVGETASTSPEQALIVLGDLSQLRVRAELEERDVSRVRVGQPVIVRSDAFPGRDFTGKVATIAKTLAPAKMTQRGVKRPNDADTLEVLVDLDPSDGLLSGMRADVFFKIDQEPRALTETPPPVKQ